MTATPIIQTRHIERVPGSHARCTVGLLTWNGGAEAEQCVAALLAQREGAFQIAWVDNASSNDVVARLRQKFQELPDPTINSFNAGFCTGHNELLAAGRTPYYLALNQDAELDPDYLQKLCDWFDAEPKLALASGLILRSKRPQAIVDSAGLAWPPARFPFSLGSEQPIAAPWRERRIVSGVMGVAMMLRVEAAREVSEPENEIFPQDYFAYHEEVDLAQRLGRAGWLCGSDGGAEVIHAGSSSGGRRQTKIRAHDFANHWLLTLRNDSLSLVAREFPLIARGELRWWVPRYVRQPIAFLLALARFFKCARRARGFYHAFERRHGPTRERLRLLRDLARRELDEVRRINPR